MNQEFAENIKNHIREYLPVDYQDAKITLEKVTKGNDRILTGLIIRKDDETAVPSIYLEHYEEQFGKGRPMDDIMKEIAQIKMENSLELPIDVKGLQDYETARPLLAIRLCDPEKNQEYLKDKPHTACGELAATYRIQIMEDSSGTASAVVTNDMLNLWGITPEQLHHDTVSAENARNPVCLYTMDDVMSEIMLSVKPENLFEQTEPLESEMIPMYILTNQNKVNGAGVLARDGVLDKIGELLGSDFYVLPSSTHEVILVPDNGNMQTKELEDMVKEVNAIEAVRYMAGNNDVMSNSTKVLHRSLSAKNLAFLNFARNRKKTALTILSLGVCGILLMASSAYFNSIDPLAMARRSFPYGEIRLELGDYGPQAHNSEQYSELQKSNLLTEDFRESILDIDGVEEIKEYQGTVLNVRMPTGDIEPIVSDAYTPSSQKLLEEYLIDGTADLQELINNNGIIIENGPQWKETFGWDAAIGDELLIEVGGQTLEVKVMGIVDTNIPYGGYDTLFIPLEMLSKIVPIENLNYQFIVDTDDSKWAAAKDEIQKIIPPTSSLYVSTLNDWVEAYNEKLLNYRMPVYIFVMFIGVFGIINLLNTLITNILTRKRELGVLQAVGLSSKQLSKMLLIEGLFYTLGVLLLSISCGTLIGYLLCTVFSAMSIFGKVSYHFPTVEMFSYFILMLAVQMLFSYLAIRQIKKQSLVDQIRELS